MSKDEVVSARAEVFRLFAEEAEDDVEALACLVDTDWMGLIRAAAISTTARHAAAAAAATVVVVHDGIG